MHRLQSASEYDDVSNQRFADKASPCSVDVQSVQHDLENKLCIGIEAMKQFNWCFPWTKADRDTAMEGFLAFESGIISLQSLVLNYGQCESDKCAARITEKFKETWPMIVGFFATMLVEKTIWSSRVKYVVEKLAESVPDFRDALATSGIDFSSAARLALQGYLDSLALARKLTTDEEEEEERRASEAKNQADVQFAADAELAGELQAQEDAEQNRIRDLKNKTSIKWMWKDAQPIPFFHQGAKLDPLRWSSRMHPAELAVDMDKWKHTSRPVTMKIKFEGSTSKVMHFSDPRSAARWLCDDKSWNEDKIRCPPQVAEQDGHRSSRCSLVMTPTITAATTQSLHAV